MKKFKDIFSEKFLRIFLIVLLSITLLSLFVYLFYLLRQDNTVTEDESSNPEGLMLLIEFEDTVGLNNFVYQMNERSIPGLLSVNATFVEENCEFVKGIQEYDIEIAGSAPGEPFWEIPYEKQYEIIKDTKDRIEACTGNAMRVIGSRYFAYDENTLKIADELGIEYVFARGTTGPKSTIYKAEEYDVKIFSVSNIDSPKWGTGSLCDYSYWAREGTPEDFKEELYTAFETYSKVSPVSHTYLGGLKERWNDVYVDMFDNLEIDWVDLDEFGQADIYDSLSDIPDNREVQYTTPKSEIPLDEELDVDNPCAVIQSSSNSAEDSIDLEDGQLAIFHNGTGPMCLEALEFFDENDIKYVEHLTMDSDFSEKLTQYQDLYGNQSEGVSVSFGYYPFIFYKDTVFSGFNDDIGDEILAL